MPLFNPAATGSISGGTTRATLGEVVFSNSNGISFGVDGQTLTASHNGLTTQSGQAFSADGGSSTFQTLSFSNANGVSFSNNAGQVQASYTVPTLTNSSMSISDAATSGTLARLAFTNLNGVTLSLSTGAGGSHTIVGSHNALTSQSNQALSGSNGSFTFQTASFSNANGISFGTSAGPAMTASYTVPTVTNSSLSISDAATSGTLARLAFTNLNGVTLSLSTGAGGSHTIVGSHNALTSQSNQALSGSNGSFAFQTVTFGSSNGMHFYTTNGSLVGSYTVPTLTNSSMSISDAATSGTLARLAFTNLNGVTLSLSTGAAGSHTIVGSHNALTSQSNQQMTLFATGNTTQSSTGTTNASSLIFRGAGIASIGVTGGSVVVSVPAGAPSPVNFSAGTTSGDLGSVVFSNSNGISFGLNVSTITASHNGLTTAALSNHSHGNPQLNLTNLSGTTASNSAGFTLSLSAAAAGGNTLSAFQPHGDAIFVTAGQSNSSLLMCPVDVFGPFQHDRMIMPFQYSQATNSTLTVSNTLRWGWYTRSSDTLSLYASGSGTFSINGSGTVSSGSNSGIRIVSFGDTTTITAGNYVLGLLWISSTAGNNASLSHLVKSQQNSTVSGYIGSAIQNAQGIIMGLGVYSSTTTNLPTAVPLVSIRANSSAFQRPPILYFTSGTF